MNEQIDLIIIGAGPAGLACGIEAIQNGLKVLIIEKGGPLEAIRQFPSQMTFFSTPEKLEIGQIPFSCDQMRPTRVQVLEYYSKVIQHFDLNLLTHREVVSVQGEEGDFKVSLKTGKNYQAKYVVVATGYYGQTNKLNCPGEDLKHVRHYYDEAYPYFGRKVIVVGGRNSAVETALDLYRHGAEVTVVHRRDQIGEKVKPWIKSDFENRVKEGVIQLFLGVQIREIRESSCLLKYVETQEEFKIDSDFIFAMVGYRPDVELLKKSGIHIQDKLIPEYSSDTFETNRKGLFIAGSVACGCETWEIFIENGREHGRVIVESILKK